MNVLKIREDFPILSRKVGGRPIVYFDNACMSLKPRQVVDKINEYYNEYPACAERSYHKLGSRATEEYSRARELVKKFINARSEKEILFTKNTTESINLLAHSLNFRSGDTIIQTDKEHNSNLIPWQQASKLHGLKHAVVPTAKGFDMYEYEKLLKLSNRRAIVSMVHTSNLDGTSIPAKEIIRLAHEHGAKVILDCAQSAPHEQLDVKKLDVDFIAFSGHKMLGPTGTGILYGKEELLQELKPFMTGGSTVKDSTYDTVEFEDLPERFEAGLQDFAGFIGLGEATKYLAKHIESIKDHEHELNKIATEELKDMISILGPQDPKSRAGILSFNTKKMGYHDVALMLDSYANIMVRSGRHCVHSWFNAYKMDGSARASFYLYNTKEEVKFFTEKLKEILR